MTELTIIALICGIPAGAGVAIDKLLLKRTKGDIHHVLLKFWIWLDNTIIPNFGKIIGRKSIVILGAIYNFRKLNIKAIIIGILISCSLTILSLKLGTVFGGHDVLGESEFINVVVLLAINLFFDGATVFVTYHVITQIVRRGVILTLPFVMMDFFLAFCLSLTCLAIPLLIFDGKNIFSAYAESFSYWVSVVSGADSLFLTAVFYSGTTFIPTLVFLISLIFLSIAKSIGVIAKKFSLYFIERMTEVKSEENIAVFTLTGSLFSILVLLITSVIKIVEKING